MDEEWDDDLEVTLPLFTVQRALNCTTICRLTLGKAHVAHTMAFVRRWAAVQARARTSR